jgi:hypothetical protein
MADTELKLPHSSFSELTKLLIAFAKSKSPSSLSDLNKLTGLHKTLISSNNGFLESIDAIQGGNSKEATETGKKLGLALANNMDGEVEKNIRLLFSNNEFIESMLTALEIKPRSSEDFMSHIAYSLGKELKGRNKTGAGTLIEMLLTSKLVTEKEGILYLNKDSNPSVPAKSSGKTVTIKENVEDSETDENLTSITTKKIVSGLDNNNVTLNINIQLTIPETENEKVYENFFKAMKKHLLS